LFRPAKSATRPITLSEIAQRAPIGLLATGGSAVATNGVRFGKGHGYFDLEWGLLSEAGAVDSRSEIADLVHDCQVVEDDLAGLAHDAPVDWIVTPTRLLRATQSAERPSGKIYWDLLEGSPLASTPPIVELRAARATREAVTT
jgi:5-formyltetrahydrofolate cyclo-ligase